MMITPSASRPGLAYSVIMIAAIATAILLRRKPERRLPLT